MVLKERWQLIEILLYINWEAKETQKKSKCVFFKKKGFHTHFTFRLWSSLETSIFWLSKAYFGFSQIVSLCSFKGLMQKKTKMTSTGKFDDLHHFLWVNHQVHIEMLLHHQTRNLSLKLRFSEPIKVFQNGRCEF